MSTNREVVSLHFGQAGIQMGNAIWETLITEHGILANGLKDLDNRLCDKYDGSLESVFHGAPSGQYYPRSLIVDTEPTVVDEIRTGYYRKLFHPDLLMSGIEDAANNFARGFYSLGRKMIWELMKKTRFIVESCDNFRGFITYSGSGGGTGTGLYSLFIERIMLEYSGKLCISSLILSGKKLSDCVVEPYNTGFRVSGTAEVSDLNFLLDNKALYKICYKRLETFKPTYSDINRLVSPVFSSITAPFRFQGPTIGDLTEMITNLVPYPKVNYPSLSYAPFLTESTTDHSVLTTQFLTDEAFHFDNSLLNLNLRNYKIMSALLVYRGNHSKCSISKCIESLKKNDNYKWVEWCPTGFKISQSPFPSIHHFQHEPQKSVLMMCNHSGVNQKFIQINNRFDMLYRKRAFMHWYIGEGMEHGEFTNATKTIVELQMNYAEACEIPYTHLNDSDYIQEETCDTLFCKNKGSSIDEKTITENVIANELEGDRVISEITDNVTDNVMRSKISNEGENLPPPKPQTLSVKVSSSQYIPAYETKDNRIKKKSSEEKDHRFFKKESSEKNVPVNPLAAQLKFRESNEFVFSDKAKEILMENLTTLSPEIKQRMLGFTNID